MKSFCQFVLESRYRTDPGYLYHGTGMWSLYDIKDRGHLETFEPWHGTDQDTWPDGRTEKRSYWIDHPEACDSFFPTDQGRPVVVRVKKTSRFSKESTGDWFTTRPIPISDLEYWDGTKWLPVADLP